MDIILKAFKTGWNYCKQQSAVKVEHLDRQGTGETKDSRTVKN